MVEKGDNSKVKDKRLEEKEKLEAELERSLEVAKVKAAHKQIEDTEKSRKRPVVLSICERVHLFVGVYNPLIKVMIDQSKKDPIRISDTAMANVEDFERTYTSISYDFQKNLDIGDEAMKKMFPMLRIRRDALYHAIDDLQNVCVQMQQMRSYCQRLIV